MSWLKFWRGQRSSDPKPVNESEASKASYQALLNALSQGNQDEAGRQLNWLRSHCRRANAEAAERWLFALALHHARNAAEAHNRAEAVEALTAELVRQLGYDEPHTRAQAWLADAHRALTEGNIEIARERGERIVLRFSSSTDLELRGAVAMALYLQALTHGGEIELGIYARILREFDTGETATLRHCAAITLFNKAIRLHQGGALAAAFQAYATLIDRFRIAEEPALQLQVAKALVNRAAILLTKGAVREALADFEEVLERFENVPYLELQRQVAFALANRATTLDQAGLNAEAAGSRAKLLARFANSADPDIANAIRIALDNSGGSRAPNSTLD